MVECEFTQTRLECNTLYVISQPTIRVNEGISSFMQAVLVTE